MSQDNQSPNNRPRKPLFDQDNMSGTGSSSTGSSGVPIIPDTGMPQREKGPEILASHGPKSGAGGSRGTRGGTSSRSNGRAVHTSQATGERKRRKKRNKRRAAIIAISLVVVLVAGIITAYAILSNMIRGENTIAGELPKEIGAQAIPEYTGKKIVSGLVCGIDYNNETADGYLDDSDKIGNTDMILYVMFDTETDKVNILQIPRDTYVGEDVETGGIGKINAMFRYSEDPDNRIAPLAEAISDQLKLPVDFYITVDMDAVKAIVDHIGFIQVYVPQEITDAETGNLLINEGWVNITSQEVEYLVRNRNYADGDISRLRTQQSLYSALFREFKRLAPSDLVMWMRILLHYVKVGGISTIQAGGLAQEALNVEGADVTFVRPPFSGAWYTPLSGTLEGKQQSITCLVPESTAEILNEYFRPDGLSYTAEELNIYTLPVNEFGEGEAEIKTMSSIQAEEPEMPPPW